MARPSVVQVRGMGTTQAKFRWNVSFSKFPSAVASPPSSESINLRCESTNQPGFTIPTSEIEIRGHKVNQVGKLTYDHKIKLVCLETIDNLIAKFLRDWREATWQTETGISREKRELEAEILLHRLNPSDRATWEFRLIGCLLTDPSWGGDLDNSQDPLKPEIGLTYDYFKDRPL